MAEKVEELSLPSAVIMRILKDAIPDGINVSKEARNAVSRAAAIFVLYATSCANQIQISSSRKTLTANDVFLALNDMLLEDMLEPLKESLESFHAEKERKESLTKENSPTKTGAPRGRPKKSLASVPKESPFPSVDIVKESPSTSFDISKEPLPTSLDISNEAPSTSADISNEAPFTSLDVSNEAPSTSLDISLTENMELIDSVE